MRLFADYVKFCAKVEGQGVTLTFVTHVASFTHLVDCKFKIKVHRQQQFRKKLTISTFSHTKAYATKFDLDCKLGQGEASHHLNKLQWALRPQYYIPSFKTIVYWFWRRFFK